MSQETRPSKVTKATGTRGATRARAAKAPTGGKGEETRSRVIETAFERATAVGLEGLSLGDLAGQLSLSKSGLFAHFGSKTALQLSVIRYAADLFVQEVVVPAIQRSRGEPRVRALFERWLEWGLSAQNKGGCFFVSAAAELDDRPGPLRDALVQTQRDWLDTLKQAARIAVAEGHFKSDLDIDQLAFEAYALMLGCHHHGRLMRDPHAKQRTMRAFERLLESARARKRGSKSATSATDHA